jgi:hypothetical protein
VVRPSDEEAHVSDQYDGPQRFRLDLDRTRTVIVQMTSRGEPPLQPASPVLPADASPCSTVLPEMVRLPPVAWVISTRRG